MCDKGETIYNCGHSYDRLIAECWDVLNGDPCVFPIIREVNYSDQVCFECNTPVSSPESSP